MTKELIPLFSTPLIVCRNFLPVDDLDVLKNYYVNTKEIWQDYDQEMEANIQTKSKNTLKNFPKVKSFIENDFNVFIKELLDLEEDNKFVMGTNWGTKSRNGDVGSDHIHANYFWSAVFYFEDSKTQIQFSKYSQGYEYGFNKKSTNLFNSFGFGVTPSANTMIYFPSHLQHKIDVHREEKPRYSIAMNFSPTGAWGQGDSMISTDINEADYV